MTTIDKLTGQLPAREPAVSEQNRAGTPARPARPEGEAESVSLTLTSSLQISATSREMASTPAFDQAKVERIKAQIAEGRYAIDPQRIADRLIEFESYLGKP